MNPVSSTEHTAPQGLFMSKELVVDTIDQAIASFEKNDFHSQWESAKQLSRQVAQWGDRSVPYLIDRLRTAEDPNTQWFLVRILSQFEQIEVIEAIAQLLATTQNEDLQVEARKALTRIGSSAIDTVSSLLSPNNPIERRILAAKVLAYIRRGATIDPLLSVAKDDNAEIRAIAIEALGSFHDPRVTPILLDALESETDTQASICVEAIRTLGRRSDLLPHTNLVDPLQQCLQHKDLQIAKESAIALGRLGTEDAVMALSHALTQPIATSVKAAIVRSLGWIATATAIQSLAFAFEQDALLIMPTIKPEIARALGQTHQPSLQSQAAQPLITWLERENSKLGAHLSTHSFAEPPASLSVEAVLALKQAVISALARLGQTEAIAALIPLLADSDLRIQMHAHSALHQIDSRAAKTQLQRYLSNEKLPTAHREKVEESLKGWQG